MATSSQVASFSDTERENEQTEKEQSRRSTMWTPLINEISSLVDTIHALDNDETKSMDIIAEHIKRITRAIPSEPVDIWYSKQIHRVLSIYPLGKIEIPLDVLELFVSSGFDVNEYNDKSKNEYGDERSMTCLQVAIKNHHYNAVRWLVQHGADLDQCGKDEQYAYEAITPIAMLAAQKDAPLDLFDILKTPESVNGNPERKIALPLHVAAFHGYINIALRLIELGASVHQEDVNENLPLHVACLRALSEFAQRGNRPRALSLTAPVFHNCSKLILSLIDHGASVNQEDGNGKIPLHLAMKHGHTKLALLLIEHGASVNVKDSTGNLPLHQALSNNYIELAFSCMKHGASVNQHNGQGDLPLHVAIAHRNQELALFLIEFGSSVNEKDTDGRLPLHIAIRKGHTELAKSLIKHGSSVNQEDVEGDLPLHLALSTEQTKLALFLIKHGASVNVETECGYLPITYYIQRNMEDFSYRCFMRFMPERSVDMTSVCTLLETELTGVEKESSREVLSRMFQQLIQHLILTEPLLVGVMVDEWCSAFSGFLVSMKLNEKLFAYDMESFKAVYLCSVLLILLENDAYILNNIRAQVPTVGSIYHANATDNLWKVYDQRQTVKKLQTLCIQQTRQSMCSLTDNSFQSLPVPSRLRKLLMLHDVADVLCEAYYMLPKCMTIGELK